MLKYDRIHKTYQDKQIRQYVQDRCENYKDNPSKMIDSFMDRQKRSIIIDRVLSTSADGTPCLVTDPNEIK